MAGDTINAIELKQLVKWNVIRLEEVIAIEGPSGCGKSEVIAQAVEEADAMLCDIRLGQYDSVDLRGIPDTNKKTGQTVWYPPSTMPFIGNDAFPDDKIIVIFLDELGSATAPVFGVCYQLLNEFRIGEHVLKPNVRIVCALNRSSDRGITNRMPFPLANRMTWFEMAVSVDAWCDWASRVGVPGVIIAFIRWKKLEALHTYNPDSPEKVVATPRTWMKAVKYFMSDMPETLKRKSMNGAIGAGVATFFWGFHDTWSKVLPIKSIIKDPMGVELPTEESLIYATAVNVSTEMTTKNIGSLYRFLCRLKPEYAILAVQMAVARDENLIDAPEYIDFSQRYRVVFQ